MSNYPYYPTDIAKFTTKINKNVSGQSVGPEYFNVPSAPYQTYLDHVPKDSATTTIGASGGAAWTEVFVAPTATSTYQIDYTTGKVTFYSGDSGVAAQAVYKCLGDDVLAEHINATQSEIVAIEENLGPNVKGLFASLDERIKSIVNPNGDIHPYNIYASGNSIYLQYNGPDGNQQIYFYNNGSPTQEYLRWVEALDRFELSNDLYIRGNLDASGIVADGNITPIASGFNDVGTPSIAWGAGNFDNLNVANTLYAQYLYGDGSNLVNVPSQPGQSGYSGFSGYSGTSGAPGGTSGYSGYSGDSGAGYSGFSGESGFSGYSGQGAVGVSTTFTNSDLVSGVYCLTHNLGNRYNVVQVFDDWARQIIPDEVTASGINSVGIDLTSFVAASGSITGTWVAVLGGGPGNSGFSGRSGYSGWSGAGGVGSAFGPWESKTASSVYQAATDGYVMCMQGGTGAASGYTDSSNPPTTTRGWATTNDSFTMPVRKNDYWVVHGTPTPDAVYWISGGGESGYSGYSGIGTSGYSGYSGVSGWSGANPGPSGISGYSGYSGTSGYSGYSGTSGYSGVAVPTSLQEYTSSSGDWTCPAGVTAIYVTAIGGGGAGGRGVGATGGGGGSSGGHIIDYVYATTPGNTYAYSVGAGGSAAGGAGNPGGDTTFGTGTVLTAGGGRGGKESGPGGSAIGPGVGSSGAGGSSTYGGDGGGSIRAAGGAGGSGPSNPGNAGSSGGVGAGGGGGGSTTGGAYASGGSGGAGYISLKW